MTTCLLPAPGARLATDLTLPGTRPPYPAVVIRTPYGRQNHRAEARAWAARGFAAVVQDVRGRYGSEGEWRPYRHEAADGAATLRWIRARPWSDGTVVAAGASYAAHCALAAALEPEDTDTGPDAVIAAVPALGAPETAREPSGVERLLGRAGWWAAHGDRPDSDAAALDRALADDPRLLEHLPLTGLPERLGRELPSWRGLWEDGDSRDRLVDRAPAARVPLLAIGGARDPFAADTLRLWRAWGGPARLLIGPWGHGLTAEPAPDARPGHRLNLGALYTRWARAALAGTLAPGRRGALALGDSEHWHPAAAPRARTLLSRPFGRSHGLPLHHGGHFLADPARPVRSDDLSVPADGEPDRALLLSAPLPRPLDLFGPAGAKLRATADTPAADWFVRLTVLTPDGRARPLALGTARRADPPGRPAELTVPLGHLARRIAPGSRLRLEISGHHFPAHARNPHTGEDPMTATRLAPSRRVLDPAGGALLLTAGPGRRVDPVQEMCA
ncbi:peptidase S15 [Streptomyces inusitatus]|uniref:Peptidase S15 n=1 Tax=Streptomyces inusitatus TaxID=68221 RepID=A0A918QQN6_9ACTN|nr:CocE/NonD family hydrolase [Streptomyces inusitatus]GGZ60373.1 peptidase S15 [Streptomyces inusitatus]